MFKFVTISIITAMLLLSGCSESDDKKEQVLIEGEETNPDSMTQPEVETTNMLQLVDASGEAIPEGATVTIVKADDASANAPQFQEASQAPSIVASDGLLSITELSPGSYKVIVTIGGVESVIFLDIPKENFQKFANLTVPVVVDDAGKAKAVDAIIASVSGTVYNATGAPIVNAQVSLSGGSKTNGSFVAAFTDENGGYALNINSSKNNTVALLNATILVKAKGYSDYSEAIKITNKINKSGVNFMMSEATQESQGALLYSETFEGNTDGWVVNKTGYDQDENNIWHIHTSNLNITNESFLNTLVQLAPNDLSNGSIPDPANGEKAFWYGDGSSENISLGSFIGDTYETESSNLTGGTSTAANSATLTSPSIDLSNANGPINLSFKTWWEIESVNPNANGYDIMTISVSSDDGATWRDIAKLNPLSDPEVGYVDRNPIPFSNTGYNSAPLWQDQEGISLLDANGGSLAGQTIKIRYTFATVDGLYNGFRGWMIDDIEISSGEGTFPLLGANGDFNNNYDLPTNTFYPVTITPSSYDVDTYDVSTLGINTQEEFTVALHYNSNVEVEFTMQLRDSLSDAVLVENIATEVVDINNDATLYDIYNQANLTLSGSANIPTPASGTLALWIVMKDNTSKDTLLEYPVAYYEVTSAQ